LIFRASSRLLVILLEHVHKSGHGKRKEIYWGSSALGCGDNVSDEYREYWEETVNYVFNQVMGTYDRNYIGNIVTLDFNADSEEPLQLRDGLERYGVSDRRVLETACERLVKAIGDSSVSRHLKSGFTIDSQGQFFPSSEKAEDICREVYKETQRGMQPYQLDIDDLAELCGMTYEKEETGASLAFFPGEEIPPGTKMLIELEDGADCAPGGQSVFFDRTHLREIRKLLAGTASGACLLFTGSADKQKDAYVCRGYASIKSIDPPVFVKLQGRKGMTIYTNGREWFRMCGARILAPVDSCRIAQLEVSKELNLHPEDQYEGLFQALSRQGKGASVVFVDLSCEMVDKWYRALAGYGRAWKLRECSVINMDRERQEWICALSRIDGALVVDVHSGNLVYAGVVLDALGITEGRRDRGARGNSILAHVANLALLGGVEQSIAAAVFSEDGAVTSVLGSSYYGDRKARLAGCTHPLIKEHRRQ